MKLFCAYAFTGEDNEIVKKRMRLVVDTLNSNGHMAYCNMFDHEISKLIQVNDIKGIFRQAFKNLEKSEALVAIITSSNKSVGQIMEIGTALSQGKPVFLIEHKSAKGSSYLPRLADKYLQWETEVDLMHELRSI